MKENNILKNIFDLSIFKKCTSLTDWQMDDVYADDVPRTNSYRRVR